MNSILAIIYNIYEENKFTSNNSCGLKDSVGMSGSLDCQSEIRI